MKEVKREIESRVGLVEIRVLADLHIGDPRSDWAGIKAEVERIRGDERCWCVVNGDVVNWASKNSVSDIYGEALKPMEQIRLMVDLLGPIKDKILVMCGGNHEARAYKSEGIDICRLVCMQLGIEDRYSEAAAFLTLAVRNVGDDGAAAKRAVKYRIFVNHGSGGGRRDGGKINRLVEMANIIDSDIYIHSHTHVPAVIRKPFFRTNEDGDVKIVDRLFVNTAAQLDYGGYGEIYEFAPASKKTPVIMIRSDFKFYEARV